MAAWHGRAKAEQPGAPPARLLRSAKGVSTVNRRGQRHLKGETKLLFWIHLVALTAKLITCFWRWSAGNEQKLAREESPNAHPMANQALETPSASNDDSDSPLVTPGLHNFTKAIMKCDIFKNLRWSKLQGMIDSAFLNNLIDSAYTSFLTLHTKRHVRSDCRFTAANFTRIAFPMLVVQPLQQLFHCQNSFRPGERRGQFARMLICFTWWFLQ